MSLQTMLDQSARDINLHFSFSTMAAVMSTWNAGWPLIFDEDSIPERTVRNWFISSSVVENSYEPTPTSSDRQKTVNVVVRTLEAAVAAENASRITGAQASALETLYLATWFFI